MEEQKVRKMTAQELLDSFYNHHLNELISSWINIAIFEKKDPKEKVGERTMPPITRDQMPMRIEINAKEATEGEQKKFKGQAAILVAIKKREEELKKLKSDEKIYAN